MPHSFVSGLAEYTNLIFCADSSESQTANGCPVLREQGPSAERQRCANGDPAHIQLRALLSAPRNLVLFC